MKTYKEFNEARMSAAARLQRAFQREQEKSAASRKRAEELLNPPKKTEPVKEDDSYLKSLIGRHRKGDKLSSTEQNLVKQHLNRSKMYTKSKNSISSEYKEEVELDEVLTKKATAGQWIDDFVNSNNPKFAGKSKEKRKQMALAAYYAKQRNEGVIQPSGTDKIETAGSPVSDIGTQQLKGKKVKSFKFFTAEQLEIQEATVKTQKYSWGTMKTVHHGSSFSIPLHPEHHEPIAKLKDEQEHHFKDETGKHWTARRKGDDVHFQGANNGGKTKVPHASMKEEVELSENAPFKKLEHAVAYATDKVKTHRDNLDGIEVYKHSGGYDVNHTMNASGRNSLNKIGAKHLGTVYKDKPANIKEEELKEGIKTGNPGNGYHGQYPSADDNYEKTHSHVKNLTDGDDKTVKHYLDSGHGRHLAGRENDHEYIKKDFKKFKKHYRPEMHEEVIDEASKKKPAWLLAAELKAEKQKSLHKENTGIEIGPDPKFAEKMRQANEEVDETYNGPRGDKLIARSHAAHKAGDKETGSRAHKLAMKAGEKYRSNPENNAKAIAHIMSGANADYTSGKRYTGDSVEYPENANVISEVNHRDYACSGCMHPDMAKHMKTGQEADFYHSKTGDKISGVVKHNSGSEVHIKAHKDGKMGAGEVHKFKVTSKLEEAKMGKPVNVDKVNAAGQTPHEEKWESAKKVSKLKKESYTFSDLVAAIKEGMWPGTPEYNAKFGGAKQGGGAGIKKGTRYGGSLQKDEPEHDDDDAPKSGRPTGTKSGARKNLGNSKLHQA